MTNNDKSCGNCIEFINEDINGDGFCEVHQDFSHCDSWCEEWFKKEKMIIGIDFDGTCVTHEFPNIGKSIGAEEVLRDLVAKGHKLILFTMRSDKKEVASTDETIKGIAGNHLTDAVNWFNERDIPLYGINENPEQKSWTDSPKPYCHLYIDDAGLGIPLLSNDMLSGRPYVDWFVVRQILFMKGLI